MIRIERLSENNFSEQSLDHYVRTQSVQRVWRRINGQYELVRQPYIEDWSPDKKRCVARQLLCPDRIAYAALQDAEIVGFAALLTPPVGRRMVLDMLHVTAACRGTGIGRMLFDAVKAAARNAGAEVLFISACSSEETIAFYRAMGAALTSDPIPEIAAEEPYDLQLSCPI